MDYKPNMTVEYIYQVIKDTGEEKTTLGTIHAKITSPVAGVKKTETASPKTPLYKIANLKSGKFSYQAPDRLVRECESDEEDNKKSKK